MLWRHSGLFRRFVVVLGALALGPAAFLAFQLVGISKKGIQASVLEMHTKMAEKLAEKVDTFFKVNDEKLVFALVSLQKKMDWQDKQSLLRSFIETYSDIMEIGVLNAQGRVIIKIYNPDFSGDSQLGSHAKSDGFQKALRTKRSVRRLIARQGEPVLEMFHPMGPLVWARVLVSLKRLGDAISSERVGGTGFAVLVDNQGRALFYPREHLTPEAAGRLAQRSIVSAALQAQSVGSRDVPDFEGKAWVGAYAPVSSVGGAVLMLQQRDEAYVSALRMERATRWVLVIVGIIAVLGATFLARQLTRPLLSLSRGAEAVSYGDFKAQVDVSTGDELQDLAETFNRMTAELRSYSLLHVDRLVAEQRKTEAILFSIGDGILMFDGKGRIQLANRRVPEFLGLAAGKALDGRTLAEVMPESPLREAIESACADPRPEILREIDLSTPKSRRYLRITAHPVVAPATGAALGVVTALRDVTFERDLDKMKDEFLQYITHDLRNPLGSAMGFVEVLLKETVGVPTAEQHAMVSSIKRSCSRLMGMINNILDIAKMESGRICLQLRPVSLAGIAVRSLATLDFLAQQKKIQLILEVCEEFTLNADADLVERVITNLVGNAIKFTPKDGSVTVSVRDTGPAIEVCVADTGEGVPPEYMERIFQKFEQVAGQKRGGTGLGLTIAKFFVEAHLGRIWAESELDKGSRFLFSIPKGLVQDTGGAVFVRPQPA